MRIEQVSRMRWIVYDERGMILIITSNKQIAEAIHERNDP